MSNYVRARSAEKSIAQLKVGGDPALDAVGLGLL